MQQPGLTRVHLSPTGVNELEFVRGELWGNVYPLYQHGGGSPCIVRIAPSTGAVLGWIDLSGLQERQRPAVRASPDSYVYNGIAFDNATGRLLVTGKRWDLLFQIRLTSTTDRGAESVRAVCGRGKLWL